MEISAKGKTILIIIAAALIFGGGFKLAQVKQNRQESPSITNNEQKEGESEEVKLVETETEVDKAKQETIFVHVAGAVSRPGLYELPQDCRVNDALKKALPLPEADLNSLNLAEKLADGQKVQVMVKGASQSNGAAGAVQQGGKLNINTAGKEQLEALPGIGPSLAQRIIDYRQTHGFFKSVSELEQVSGIGEKKFAEIKAHIVK